MVSRNVTLVCLPGSGGPALADAVRAKVRPGIDHVRVVGVASDELVGGQFLGDPMGALCWSTAMVSCSAMESIGRAEALVRRLAWLLWEMELDVDPVVEFGSPSQLVRSELSRQSNDAVIVAASNARRWHKVLADARSLATSGCTDLRVAIDSRPSVMVRWLNR